jgi:hypothetical protein
MIKKYILFLIFFSFLTAQTLENNKSKYLQGLLNLLKNNVESVLPIKTKIGIINNVKIENNTLIMYIKANEVFKDNINLKHLCNVPLNKDIVEGGGAIKYIISKQNRKFTYEINQRVCKEH